MHVYIYNSHDEVERCPLYLIQQNGSSQSHDSGIKCSAVKRLVSGKSLYKEQERQDSENDCVWKTELVSEDPVIAKKFNLLVILGFLGGSCLR